MRLLHFAPLCSLLVLAASCTDSNDSTAPPEPPRVDLILLMSAPTGHPGEPVTAQAIISNRGGSPATWSRCSCYDVLETLGPDAARVEVRKPQFCTADCQDVELLPGDRLESMLAFDGTLYNQYGAPYPAPPGTYTMVARFTWRLHPRDPSPTDLEQRTTFTWGQP